VDYTNETGINFQENPTRDTNNRDNQLEYKCDVKLYPWSWYFSTFSCLVKIVSQKSSFSRAVLLARRSMSEALMLWAFRVDHLSVRTCEQWPHT